MLRSLMPAISSPAIPVIRFAIAHYRGQMSEVARRLQIGRSTLYRKLDTLGVVADTSEAESPSVASG